jgi:hypothetical protein
MTDITNNSQYITGKQRDDATLKDLIDAINQIIQDELIDFAEDIEKQASILTATVIWLDLIGKRLLFPRPYVEDGTFDVFGFDDGGVGFDQAPFGGTGAAEVPVSDETYRTLLIARGGQLLTDGTIPSMDSILQTAFGLGYYIDHGNMSLSVIFDGDLEPVIGQIIADTKLLTKPAGVRINGIYITHGESFGFDDGGVGFDQAPFVEYIPI